MMMMMGLAAPWQHVCTLDDDDSDYDVDGDDDYKDYDDDDGNDNDDEDEQHLGSMSVLLTAAVGVERQHWKIIMFIKTYSGRTFHNSGRRKKLFEL